MFQLIFLKKYQHKQPGLWQEFFTRSELEGCLSSSRLLVSNPLAFSSPIFCILLLHYELRS